MIVSAIIPACAAQSTLIRALASLRAQTAPGWEAIVVADDLFDYAAFLANQGFSDPRIRHATTGRVRSGCHNARNVGLEQIAGDAVSWLDADDEWTPERIATLAPDALQSGAAADNLVSVDEETGRVISTCLGQVDGPVRLDLAGFMRTDAPLVPLIRRDHVQARIAGVEVAEDVIANIRLIDRLGVLTVRPESSYVYRMRTGSITNADDSGRRFETAYSDYIARLETGDGFGLSDAARRTAREGLVRKRDVNRRYEAARRLRPGLDFQTFKAGLEDELRPTASGQPGVASP